MIRPGRFQPPSRQLVIYGERLADALPATLRTLWASQIVVVTNASLAGAGGPLDEMRTVLGDGFREAVTSLRRGTPRADVVRVASALRSRGVDAVVALGGSSVVEAAKAARLCLTNNVRDERDMDRLRGVTTAASPRPYLISVPTTLSGAEFTPWAGVTDEGSGRKEAFHHQDLAPDVVILDPACAAATPDELWFGSGLGALGHAVETWCSPAPTPASDASALYGFRVLVDALPRSRRDRQAKEAGLACQVGAWMAIGGAALGVPLGASHGIGAALSTVTGIGHGVASALLLPSVLRFNAAIDADRQQSLAATAGVPDRPLADLVAGLAAELELPARLRDAGVAEDRLPDVAASALGDPRLQTGPRPIGTQAEALALLRAAW